MEHANQVRQEFARQAAHFAAAPAIANNDLTERFIRALGGSSGGDILDVACGPGLVTAALARQARQVTALDLTPEMLARARQRCEQAGVRNVAFHEGSATALPFAADCFDAVVTRLSIHHFAEPSQVLAEMVRVLRPGGVLVVADVVSADNQDDSAVQNAIEVLRDPSHVRMLPSAELLALVCDSGLRIVEQCEWDTTRRFDEWAAIVDHPRRVAPLRTIVRALASAGVQAGMHLQLEGDDIVFIHRWHMIVASKP